MEVNLISMVG